MIAILMGCLRLDRFVLRRGFASHGSSARGSSAAPERLFDPACFLRQIECSEKIVKQRRRDAVTDGRIVVVMLIVILAQITNQAISGRAVMRLKVEILVKE